MKSLLLVLLVGCGSSKDEPPAKADAGYTGDIGKLCDVIALSKSTDLEPNDRMFQVATWLGANLQTPDARKFLAKIQPLGGEAKADALDAEAKRVGLSGCALAAEWRKPH